MDTDNNIWPGALLHEGQTYGNVEIIMPDYWICDYHNEWGKGRFFCLGCLIEKGEFPSGVQLSYWMGQRRDRMRRQNDPETYAMDTMNVR